MSRDLRRTPWSFGSTKQLSFGVSQGRSWTKSWICDEFWWSSGLQALYAQVLEHAQSGECVANLEGTIYCTSYWCHSLNLSWGILSNIRHSSQILSTWSEGTYSRRMINSLCGLPWCGLSLSQGHSQSHHQGRELWDLCRSHRRRLIFSRCAWWLICYMKSLDSP